MVTSCLSIRKSPVFSFSICSKPGILNQVTKGFEVRVWNLYNGRIKQGEHIRVFPISNYTELDIWQYIKEEGIEIPNVYFSHQREVFERDGMLLSTGEFITLMDDEEAFIETVRYRTVGDMSCTGAVESGADTLDKIIEEVAATRITERGATRADDRVSEAAMEDRKKEGYF